MGVYGYVAREAQEATNQRHLESGFADQDVNRLKRPRHHQERVRRRRMVGGDDLRARRHIDFPLDVRTYQSTNVEVRDLSSHSVKELGRRRRSPHTLLPPGIRSVGGLASSCCQVLASSASWLPNETQRCGGAV